MKRALLFALALTLVASSAFGDIITADFGESLDFPDYGGGPKILQRLGVSLPPIGPYLTDADIYQNPQDFPGQLLASFDPSTNILSLVASAGLFQYQTITVSLESLMFNVPGQHVIGITPISAGNTVHADTDPGGDPTVPTIVPFYTATSFGVTYSVPLGEFDYFVIDPAGTDRFQVTLSGDGDAVPEPATITFLGIGAGALLLLRRRRIS